MTVKSRKEAWNMANRLFPTDYEKDDICSKNAGHPIYKSTSSNEEYRFVQIADLNCRLEVNDGIQTINIWIDEEEEVKGMKATIRSMINEFTEYEISGVISAQFIAGNLILTYMKENEVLTSTYNASTVIVEVH